MFLSQSLFQTVQHDIQCVAGARTRVKTIEPVAGGDINQAFRIGTDDETFFVKTNNRPNAIQMFRTELTGLAQLRRVTQMATPLTYSIGQARGDSYLLMEWIEPAPTNQTSSEALGTLLATIHRQTQPVFGLDHDNFIAHFPQGNTSHASWT